MAYSRVSPWSGGKVALKKLWFTCRQTFWNTLMYTSQPITAKVFISRRALPDWLRGVHFLASIVHVQGLSVELKKCFAKGCRKLWSIYWSPHGFRKQWRARERVANVHAIWFAAKNWVVTKPLGFWILLFYWWRDMIFCPLFTSLCLSRDPFCIFFLRHSSQIVCRE